MHCLVFQTRMFSRPLSPNSVQSVPYTPGDVKSPPSIRRMNNINSLTESKSPEQVVNGDGSVLDVPSVQEGSQNLFLPFNIKSVDKTSGVSVIQLNDDLKYRSLCLKLVRCKEVIEEVLDVLDIAHFSDNYLDSDSIYFDVAGGTPYEPLDSHLFINHKLKSSTCKSVELPNIVYILHILRTLPLPTSSQGVEQLIRRLDLCKIVQRYERTYKDVNQSSFIAYLGFHHGIGLHHLACSYVQSLSQDDSDMKVQLDRLKSITEVNARALEEILVDLSIFVENYYINALEQVVSGDHNSADKVESGANEEKVAPSPLQSSTKKRSITNESSESIVEQALSKRARLFSSDDDVQLAQDDPVSSASADDEDDSDEKDKASSSA